MIKGISTIIITVVSAALIVIAAVSLQYARPKIQQEPPVSSPTSLEQQPWEEKQAQQKQEPPRSASPFPQQPPPQKPLPMPAPSPKITPIVTPPTPPQSQEPKVTERVWWIFRNEWEPSRIPPPCPENLIIITPTDINQVTSILYPGKYRGGHYKAHGGFGLQNSDQNNITVRIPQDGFVVSGVRYYELGELQYLFDIEHPCGLRFRFDHLRVLSPKFQNIANMLPLPKVDDTRGTRLSDPVAVTTGEVIATGVAFERAPNTLIGFDFGMYDLRELNNKATTDSVWLSQHWGDQAPYALCWLDFLPQPDRSVAKSLPVPDGSFDIQSDYCK